MSDTPDRTGGSCQVFRAGAVYSGKQGFDYAAGISTETAGARGICMHLLTIPPGGRSKAHQHSGHESAIYVLSGEAQMWSGERMEHHVVVRAGDMLYIPAGVPHLPVNLTDAPVTAVIARTDPNEQESVELRPDLEALVPG